MSPSKELTAEHNGEVVEGVPMRTLDELSVVIVEGHQAAENALRTWLDSAGEVGRALMEARPQVPRGQWYRWLARAGMSNRMANRYYRVAVHEEALREAGALTSSSAVRMLTAAGLGSGIPVSPSTDPALLKRARSLVHEQGLTRGETAILLGVSQSTVEVWIDPELKARRSRAQREYKRERRERQRVKAKAKAASREAELALQVRDTAHEVGGDYEKAVEYMTKLDQILGRAREQAKDSPDRRKAAIEAHKYRDRAMDALRRGLGL